MTIKDLGDLIIWAGGVAAALSAIGFLVYRVFVRAFVRWLKEQIVETRQELGETRQALGETKQTAEAVHAEVTPNHGTSLKDAVTRTEQKVDQLDRRFTDHLINHPGS
ncbi:hypothetical protein [Actinomadura formosensis]|uniref:hypothetical protein n=1 Tax=Actinomadura formosensis TaxID=60706 RepID=UPI003D8C68BE